MNEIDYFYAKEKLEHYLDCMKADNDLESDETWKDYDKCLGIVNEYEAIHFPIYIPKNRLFNYNIEYEPYNNNGIKYDNLIRSVIPPIIEKSQKENISLRDLHLVFNYVVTQEIDMARMLGDKNENS